MKPLPKEINGLKIIKDLGMQYPTKNSKGKKRFSIFQCKCGDEFRAIVPNVKRGSTNSCGCYKVEKTKQKSVIHNMAGTRIYRVWEDIKKRCNNPKNKGYKNYGGRGITYDPSWEKFENFYNDIKDGYQDNLTIDRKDNDGNYCKENCRWSTRAVQARNSRKLKSTNTSGYRGVSFKKRNKKYVARVVVNNEHKHLGYFKDPIQAAKAYDKYIIDNNLEHTMNFSL